MGYFLLLALLPLLLFLLFRYIVTLHSLYLSARLMQVLYVLFLVSVVFFTGIQFFLIENTYLSGYRSHSIAFLAMTTLGFFYFLFREEEKEMKVPVILIRILLLVCVPMASFLAAEMSSDYKSNLYYRDTKYRLEDECRGFMCSCRLPTLFIKEGLLEKKYRLTTDTAQKKGYSCFTKQDVDSILIQKQNSVVMVSFFLVPDSSRDISNPFRAFAIEK